MAPRQGHAIGVFDSGLGGLTVARALAARLPNESLLYLGDTARVPYGTKSPDTVVRYAQRNMSFMRKRGVKAVVVACNTVSAQGLSSFTNTDDPTVFGVITPGAKAALEVSKQKRIAILGTPSTIASNAYPRALKAIDKDAQAVQVACPLFVPLAEEGWVDHQVTTLVSETYLAQLQAFKPDTIVLGCTHYPILETVITLTAKRLLGPNTSVINSAKAVAEDVHMHLKTHNQLATLTTPNHEFYATDVCERSQNVAQRFWHNDPTHLPTFKHVDLPN